MGAASTSPAGKEIGVLDEIATFLAWCRRRPLDAALLAGLVAVFVWFFGFVKIFVNGSETTAQWARLAWNPEAEQDYCMIVPPVALWLFWDARGKIRAAQKSADARGLIFVALGVLLFVMSARVLEPRIALASIPFFIFGSVFYLAGPRVARIVLFPCAFLFFMEPLGALEPMTARLQGGVTWLVGVIGNIVGLNIQSDGTTIMAADRSFNFQIAEGCSGIRSITALTMLSAIYVHLAEPVMWKKIVTFCASFAFAIIGNAGRIFTIIVVARLGYPEFAGGKYHHISGFISFPFALAAMLGFSKLLNIDWKKLTAREPKSAAQSEAPKYDY